jgi:hypothetical protein
MVIWRTMQKEKVCNFHSSLDITKGHNTLRLCIITIQHLNFVIMRGIQHGFALHNWRILAAGVGGRV